MKTHDDFRPTQQPAQCVYDAFQAEAAKRKGRSTEEWVAAERQAVWSAARDYAQQHGLPVPTLEQIERKEQLAVGHSDYAATWAYGVAKLLLN
jgi:hypothetical protein